ncbi:MAG: hypothetical protein ACI8S6_000837 [Myxococcota bacterium]
MCSSVEGVVLLLLLLAGCLSEQALIEAQAIADYHLYAHVQLQQAAAFSPGDHYSTTIQPDGDIDGFMLAEVDRVATDYQQYSDDEVVVTYQGAGLVRGDSRWSGEGWWDIDLEEDVHVLDLTLEDGSAQLTIWSDGSLWLVKGYVDAIPVPKTTVRRVPDEAPPDSGGCKTVAHDGC